jgi:hypothetical protein
LPGGDQPSMTGMPRRRGGQVGEIIRPTRAQWPTGGHQHPLDRRVHYRATGGSTDNAPLASEAAITQAEMERQSQEAQGPGGGDKYAKRGGGKWMQSAVKHPGALGRSAARAGMSTHEFAEKHKHSPGKTGKRARLALIFAKHRPH